MKKFLISVATACFLLVLVGCGKSNKLVGTWNGATTDGIKVKWIFEKDDVVKYENEFNIKSEGTYKIKDDVVTISLKVWSEPIDYTFEVKDGKLDLTAQNQFSPSYEKLVKEN